MGDRSKNKSTPTRSTNSIKLWPTKISRTLLEEAEEKVRTLIGIRDINTGDLSEQDVLTIYQSLLQEFDHHPFALRTIDSALAPTSPELQEIAQDLAGDYKEGWSLMFSGRLGSLAVNSSSKLHKAMKVNRISRKEKRPLLSSDYFPNFNDRMKVSISHEVGHTRFSEIANKVGIDGSWELLDLLKSDQIFDSKLSPDKLELLSLLRNMISDPPVSLYSETNSLEAFAEGYTLWRHRPETLSPEARGHYNRLNELLTVLV